MCTPYEAILWPAESSPIVPMLLRKYTIASIVIIGNASYNIYAFRMSSRLRAIKHLYRLRRCRFLKGLASEDDDDDDDVGLHVLFS
jgi:hypothetical protein